ncbi:MAG TPA: FtsX-like permease family protein [Streptosporangiaceae bacterium]|nr:FtsX-like permease family protein [Streptosporangiaceae bacterium]
MSIALRDPPDLAGGAGGIVARRAVVRWAMRLFRREWRQQLLVLGLLTVAVAATIWGTSVVTNTQLPNPDYATLGTAAVQVTLPGADPRLAADIAAIAGRWGPADVIESQDIATGTTQSVPLRAENPHGHYNAPLVSLVSGTYPAGPGQVALTSQVANLYRAHVGGTWQAAGTTWRVTGIVQNPSNLADEFALVVPGQVTHPSQAIMLLGSSAVQQAVSNGNATLPGIPAAATVTPPNAMSSGISPATGILMVEVLGLVFIGLVSVAGFSVMAQRRLRALGMLSALGATERHLRLVMIVNGLVVGVAGALAGAVLGFAAWFAYVPTLQQATGHVVDATNVPWWAFAIGVLFAIATSVLASRRPGKTVARVPVVAALSGRPAPPKPAHRSALPGVIVFAVGVGCLASADGLAGVDGGSPKHAPFLLAGLVATIVGVVLLAPLAISVLAAGAGPRLPVAVRIALRDLVRYRARSGAALAATTFAVFLAMGICIVASIRFDNPLDWIGPNLSSSQLIFYTQQNLAPGELTQLGNAQAARLGGQVDSLAASLHARSAVPLEFAGGLHQVDAPAHGPSNFTGTVYVATPRLLATYGIKASQIAPGTDFLTMRPGLAGLPHMEMIWGTAGSCTGTCLANPADPGDDGGPPCTLSNDCLANPAIQTVSNLPGGTSAPNTLITEYAMNTYHLQPSLNGWLIQAPAPLTATQISAARHLALAYGVTIETKSDNPDAGTFTHGATALGIVIALGVLAASVGLIRSETARDLRTLTATGASGATRRVITAATAAALGLLGAILGMAGAVIAGLAWAHGNLSAMFGDLPLTDVLILLIGLPLIASVAGWLLAGREPEAVARQPLD